MKQNFRNINYVLLILMIVYTVLGIVIILSASSVAAVLKYKVPSNYFAFNQLKYVLLAYFAGILVISVPTSKYKYIYRIFFYGMIGCLCAVLFIGKISNGARAWLEFAGKRFQPLEFTKIALIVYLAIYYYKLSLKTFKKRWFYVICFLFPIFLSLIVFYLLAKQPDLGGAIIVAFIMILVFFSIPIKKKDKRIIYLIVFAGLALSLLTFFVFKDKLLDDYQKKRFEFANPCSRYQEQTGYQVCNSYIAIHNGNLSGVKLGNSTQKYMYLPEAHTDFIFSILVEELGLIIGIIVVIGYYVMLFIILNIAKKSNNLRNSILAYGIFSYLLAHILVNLLGILGLIPLTGVPLPFLSYGGTYNISVIISLFIVQRINIETKLENDREKIKNIR